jgi:AcrR family transcriptional regulator
MTDSIIESATQEMAESKKALLMAGLDLFSKKGVDGVSLADISAISGYSRPVIFKFYKTKLEMAVDIFSICYKGLYDKLKPVAESNSDFLTRLIFFCEISAQVVAENSDSLFMVTENLRLLLPEAKGLDIKKSIMSLTVDLIKKGQQERVVGKDLTAEDLAIALIGLIQQMARVRYFADQKKSKKSLTEIFLKLSKRIFDIKEGKSTGNLNWRGIS